MPQLSAIKPNDAILSEEAGLRRAMACTAFWSDHPLNVTFRSARQTETFSLRDFTAFVVALPADQFHNLVGGSDAR